MNRKINLFITLFLFGFLPSVLLAQRVDENKLLNDIEYLSSDALEGRKPLSEGSLLAREYIKNRFRDLKLTSQFSEFTQFFDFESTREGEIYKNAANMIGFVPGEESEKIIVVMAHYDHIGKKGSLIYNGADDNASGTASLLALAEYFSVNRPRHSMMFVALDAEEMGLQGAKALIADFPFPLDQVLLTINMDMISRDTDNDLYAVGTYHYPALKPILEAASKGKSINLKLGHDTPGTGAADWTFSSDHAVFHQEKIPFIYFGVEDHEDYHKPTDTFENIDQTFYINAVEMILEVLISLDQKLVKEVAL